MKQRGSEPRNLRLGGPYSVRDLQLIDCEPADAFDAITRLSARVFDVPVSLISIVQEDEERQFFTSAYGLSEPWRSQRQTPLSHSFCQHVKSTGRPLIVDDAQAHPLLCANQAIPDLNVIAYLGVPIADPDGHPIGALCVIDEVRRHWTERDVANLQDLSNCVQQEIQLRASALAWKSAHQKTRRYNALREAITLAFMAPDLQVSDRFTELLRAGCEGLRMDSGILTKIEGDRVELLFGYGIETDLIGRHFGINGSLTGLVAAGQEQLHLADFAASDVVDLRALDGTSPCCYAGTPLIFDGALYGTLEFIGTGAKTDPWTNEESSMLSIISMLACAHLGLFGQIKTLQNSEAALLQYLLDTKHGPINPIPSYG